MSTTITVNSRQGVPIRLTAERWAHIAAEHGELTSLRDEILRAIMQPERILAGSEGELLAVRERSDGKTLVVVYREFTADGFIITAFLTGRIRSLERRKQLWP